MSQRGLQILSSLPPELQFQVLKRCNVESLKSFMVINENYRIYCDSAIRENLESIFSNHQFELSIFTPQQENIRAELYKTKCCTEIGSRNIGMESQEVLQKYDKKENVRYHDSYLYGLQLTGTRDVLSDKTFKAEKGEQKTNTNNQVESEQPFIHLVISEGVKYIQLHLSLYARSIDASTPTLETHGTIVLNEEDKYQKGILSLSGESSMWSIHSKVRAKYHQEVRMTMMLCMDTSSSFRNSASTTCIYSRVSHLCTNKWKHNINDGIYEL